MSIYTYMKILSNLKRGIIYNTHNNNLKKIDILESQLYKKHSEFQKELTKSNYSYKDEGFNPFRQL